MNCNCSKSNLRDYTVKNDWEPAKDNTDKYAKPNIFTQTISQPLVAGVGFVAGLAGAFVANKLSKSKRKR
ncbi:MAG: hypothetical protein LBO69_06135 [Ignavibacteria bacterium]|jgi:hypothetical protein|nr:hypothetical protein [Ignavibacteria bacterium]